MPLRVGLVVPHIFMHRDILPKVIFSPAKLACQLASELSKQDVEVFLYTPGPIYSDIPNVTVDLSLFERELAGRGYGYLDLLAKHPLLFVTLARQVQSEIIARAYADANSGKLDIVHVYTNEEEIALPFAQLCQKPVVFTHHDPFNFLVKYKNNLPKYNALNWISMSMAQRRGMPKNTNWIANIYHGLSNPVLKPVAKPENNYIAYLGRIIQPKGVHLAIAAVQHYNKTATVPINLKIAGKHYAENSKDDYWKTIILPQLNDPRIEYVGFMADDQAKGAFLANAKALLVPSLFDEPFGMVTIEAFACGTPVIALDSGALPEVIEPGVTGFVVPKFSDCSAKPLSDKTLAADISACILNLSTIDRARCRTAYETRFTAARMAAEHLELYQQLALAGSAQQ